MNVEELLNVFDLANVNNVLINNTELYICKKELLQKDITGITLDYTIDKLEEDIYSNIPSNCFTIKLNLNISCK